MATDMQKWVNRTARLEEQVQGLAGGPQLAMSSIEDGHVNEYDETGQLVSSIGKQYDGSHVAVPLVGPVPPAPVAPSCVTGPGVLEVRWSGKFADGAVSTLDFKNVDVHVSATSGFEPDLTTQRATIRGELGDVAALAQEAGTYYVRLVSRSLTGKSSAASPEVVAVVPIPADGDAIADALEQMDTSIAAVQDAVNGVNKVINATTDPDQDGGSTGDRWQKWTTLATGGRLLKAWRWDGTVWIPELMDPSYLPLVDIGQGTFGTLSGGRLEAGTVQASSIAVGDFTNFATIDPVRGVNVSRPATWATVTDGGYTRSAPGTENYLMFKDRTNTIPFKPGDQLRVTFDAIADEPVQARVSMFLYPAKADGANTNTAIHDAFMEFDATEKTYSRAFTVSSSAVGAFQSWVMGLSGSGAWNGTTAHKIRIRNVAVYRMNGGAMIVDGAFDARTITAPIIQSEAAPNRGVKFKPDGIVAFNGVGTETFRLSATTGEASFLGRVQSGSTIEGADITGATITGGAITMDSGDGYAIDLGTRASSAFIRFRTPSTILGVYEAGTMRGEEDQYYNETRVKTVMHSPTNAKFDTRTYFSLAAGRSQNLDIGVNGYAYLKANLILQADGPTVYMLGDRDKNVSILTQNGNLDLSGNTVAINDIPYGQDTGWVFLDLSPGMVARSGAQYRPRARLKDGEVSIVGQIDRGASSINSGGVMLVLPPDFRTDYEVAIPITLATSVNSWIRPNVGEFAVGASSTGGWQVLNAKYTK